MIKLRGRLWSRLPIMTQPQIGETRLKGQVSISDLLIQSWGRSQRRRTAAASTTADKTSGQTKTTTRALKPSVELTNRLGHMPPCFSHRPRRRQRPQHAVDTTASPSGRRPRGRQQHLRVKTEQEPLDWAGFGSCPTRNQIPLQMRPVGRGSGAGAPINSVW